MTTAIPTTTIYHGFAFRQQALNQQLVELVTDTVETKAIWLLGLSLACCRTESLFSRPSATRQAVSHYWLLVVTTRSQPHNRLQDSLETRLRAVVPCTVIVAAAGQWNGWLATGHPFAAAVQERGYRLYQSPEAALQPTAAIDAEALKAINQRLFSTTVKTVAELLAGSRFYTGREQYRLAALLLHQAAEQALRAMMILHTGLRLNTHSLPRLIACCALFCYQLPDQVVGNTEEDKVLFALLQAAYTGSRYRDDYHITATDMEALYKRAERLETLLHQWGQDNEQGYSIPEEG